LASRGTLCDLHIATLVHMRRIDQVGNSVTVLTPKQIYIQPLKFTDTSRYLFSLSIYGMVHKEFFDQTGNSKGARDKTNTD